MSCLTTIKQYSSYWVTITKHTAEASRVSSLSNYNLNTVFFNEQQSKLRQWSLKIYILFARWKQICTPYWNYLRKCNLTKSRLAAISAAHIRNTINTLKLTFKTFITKKCVLITWTKTWAGRMVLGVGRERWGRVSGNTQCCTSTNVSLCALTSLLILCTHAFKNMQVRTKLEKNLNAWYATFHFML